ncbi:hypothetical protein C7N43_15265 [Sphingobacteriales bacterium UPWRP_1]|nr:hypothetical protein BVG80_08275 [Sphingobacteriales bacterium TSM_CSM]PSJ76136.1 hypothetical protein C7N43_15265 [Sphingobacteriales bacterium UPWRP_1]
MENQHPKIVEITTPRTEPDITETQKTTPPPADTTTTADDALLRAIADAGMDLLKQAAKERVSKFINDLQQKGNLNPNEGKQVLEQLQRETELARLRAEQQAALAQPAAPASRQFKKLKKKVKRLQKEVQELRAMVLLLSNNSSGKG